MQGFFQPAQALVRERMLHRSTESPDATRVLEALSSKYTRIECSLFFSIVLNVFLKFCVRSIIPCRHKTLNKTSHQRRCDVITSQRRRYDVVLTSLPAGIRLRHFFVVSCMHGGNDQYEVAVWRWDSILLISHV